MSEKDTAREKVVGDAVEGLFQNADRLVLRDDQNDRYLGGWSRLPVKDRLRDVYDAGYKAGVAAARKEFQDAIRRIDGEDK